MIEEVQTGVEYSFVDGPAGICRSKGNLILMTHKLNKVSVGQD